MKASSISDTLQQLELPVWQLVGPIGLLPEHYFSKAGAPVIVWTFFDQIADLLSNLSSIRFDRLSVVITTLAAFAAISIDSAVLTTFAAVVAGCGIGYYLSSNQSNATDAQWEERERAQQERIADLQTKIRTLSENTAQATHNLRSLLLQNGASRDRVNNRELHELVDLCRRVIERKVRKGSDAHILIDKLRKALKNCLPLIGENMVGENNEPLLKQVQSLIVVEETQLQTSTRKENVNPTPPSLATIQEHSSSTPKTTPPRRRISRAFHQLTRGSTT